MRRNLRLLLCAALKAFVLLSLAHANASEFSRKAYTTLPVEESYTFHKQLSEWREPLRRDPALKPFVNGLRADSAGTF